MPATPSPPPGVSLIRERPSSEVCDGHTSSYHCLTCGYSMSPLLATFVPTRVPDLALYVILSSASCRP